VGPDIQSHRVPAGAAGQTRRRGAELTGLPDAQARPAALSRLAAEGDLALRAMPASSRVTQKRIFRASCRIRGELNVLEITPNEEELDTAEPGFEKFG
jgi:hypothetical protein